MANARLALNVTVAAIGLVAVPQAHAQNAAGASGSADSDVIVVTAQRRSENIQDVPISITALSAETLEDAGIEDSRDLVLLTPGLRVDAVGAYVQPAIRGVTTTLTAGPEANIATYLDGVYRPNTFAAIYDLPDVQQIEVLKGPQGTLFGRNATGGAILITTMAPDLDELTGKFKVHYASFETIGMDGFVSVPLVQDRVALSVSGYYEDISDGWKHNLVTGADDDSGIETAFVRAKLRFVPWEGADFTLAGLYSVRHDDSAYRASIYQGLSDDIGVPGVIVGVRPYDYAADVVSYHDTGAYDISLRGDIEVGPGTLTTSTAYSYSWSHLYFDASSSRDGGSFFQTETNYESWSQELIYATNQLGRFRAVAGLFYFQTESNTEPFLSGASLFQLWFRDKGKSYAAFGEVTYDITDQLSITGGLRYSYEKRKAARGFGGGTQFIRPDYFPVGEASFDSFTPRVSVIYEVTPDTNVYATYSQGFKSGIFNTPGGQATPVRPEKIKAFEVGVKSVRWNG